MTTPPDWWTWAAAVEQHSPSEGAFATAHVWARHAWSWTRGTDDRRRPREIYLYELAALHARPISTRTAQRRVQQLVAAGLLVRLRGHSPHGPDVYAPTINTGQVCPVSALDTGHPRPVSSADSGREGPVSAEDTGHERLVLARNTGQSASQHRTSGDTTPFPSDLSDPPRASGQASTGPGAGAREDGGKWIGEEALVAVLRSMDAKGGDSRKVADGFRRQAATALGVLRHAGWPADQLAERINAQEWGSARSPGRVLLKRIEDLADEPVPQSAAERHAERQARQGPIERPERASPADVAARVAHLRSVSRG